MRKMSHLAQIFGHATALINVSKRILSDWRRSEMFRHWSRDLEKQIAGEAANSRSMTQLRTITCVHQTLPTPTPCAAVPPLPVTGRIVCSNRPRHEACSDAPSAHKRRAAALCFRFMTEVLQCPGNKSPTCFCS